MARAAAKKAATGGSRRDIRNESLFLRIREGANWHGGFLRYFRLASFEFSLAKIGRFGWIGSNGQISFLDEVAPALVVAGRTLRLLKLFQGRFCFIFSPDNRHHSTRPISSDVVQDDHVGSTGVFACQMESIRSLLKSDQRNRIRCNHPSP